MDDALLPLYIAAFPLFFIAWITIKSGWANFRIIAAAIGTALLGAWLVMRTVGSGLTPVFTTFEALLFAAFLLAFMNLLFTGTGPESAGLRTWGYGQVLLILVITLFLDKSARPPYYDHGDPFIVSFHLFRAVSLALMLFSSAGYIRSWGRKGTKGIPADHTVHRARNILLLSAIAYLCSEYAGIIWCLNGWGDFWMWSANFFQSTLLLVYLMFVFHLPESTRGTGRLRTAAGAMSGFFMLSLMVVRSIG